MATAEQRTAFLDAARSHFAADMLLKGTYADEGTNAFKGCSVGCFLHSAFPGKSVEQISDLNDKHRLVAEHYGYPEWLALLQDAIFEGLPNGESARWHVQLAETLAALPDNYDWKNALHRVHVAILRISYNTAGSAREAVQRVIDLHECAISGNMPSEEEWSAAESAARSAAESAARSAAESAAESAARSAARSAAWSAARSAARYAAESAARYAAESAAWSAARSAAWSAAFQEIRDAVLQTLASPAAA